MPGALLAVDFAATFELQGGRCRRSTPDAASYTRPMWLAAYFAFVGVLFLLHWVVTDPSFDATDTMTEWPYVLAFSAALLSLACALPLLARLAGGQRVVRVSLVPAAGAALGSFANVLEDGLGMDWAFWVFVMSTGLILLGLVAFAMVMVRDRRGRDRLLALIPAGT